MSDPSPQPNTVAGTKQAWYALSKEDVAKNLGVTPDQGISSAESATRIKSYGRNVLEEEDTKKNSVKIPEKSKKKRNKKDKKS